MTEQDAERILLAVLYIAGAAGCFLLHPASGVVFCAAGLAFAAVHTYFDHKRRKYISHISDEIGQILRGAEQIELERFSEGELSVLSDEIRKMTVMLREQNAAIRQERNFMKEAMEDISHQLRTPLTSAMLTVQMLRSSESNPQQQRENMQELVKLLTRMQWLIETLLGLSRLEAGAVMFQNTEIRCAALLQEAIEPISVAMELKDITMRLDIDEDAVFTGDWQYCIEALCNLLKNCMEHTPAGGEITVSAKQNVLYTGIVITDSGNGIAPEDLPHIFERFYRGSTFSKSGYGIGLAFARKIIAAQNGVIQVRNAEPHGAQFEIRFYRQIYQ